MNPVTFNQQFEQMEYEMATEGAPTRIPQNWRTAPLFAYECDYEHEINLLKQTSKETEFRLPFDVMRLSVIERAKDRGRYYAEFVIDATDNENIAFMGTVKDLFIDWPDRPHWARVMPLAFQVDNLRWNDREGDDETVLYKSAFRYAGVWMRSSRIPWDMLPAVEEMRKIYVNGAVDALAAFALDAMMPTSHLVKVRPDAPGRSVEWIRARTHYTFISHGHPANNPAITLGARVRTDAAGELIRMAHNRRAHKRQLRSERFRFARGKIIDVRATWVGPKSWCDEGGKQIYKILEPVKDYEIQNR
jgi:hypothetical protein